MPSGPLRQQPALVGRATFAGDYATRRFNRPGLHAQLVNRMVLGGRVIDHGRISGVGDGPFDVAVVYEAADGLLQAVRAFAAA